MGIPNVSTKQLAAASSNNIALSQSPATAALTLNGSTVTAGVATLDTPRRVIITSGGNDSAIKWTVAGTNGTNPITDIFAGSNGGAAQSNLDFLTISSITPSASVASTAIAGTNGVGSTPWITLNWHATSVMNTSVAVELVSGAVNFSVQHTYDDPNNTNNIIAAYGLAAGQTLVPLPYTHPSINGASATIDGSYTTPIAAVRLLVNSGTGLVRFRVLQSGIK